MQLFPEKEKEILHSMLDACIGSAVGRNYVFSKLGRYIAKAQIAYFTSKPSYPLSDGRKKSDTDSFLDFFEATEEISYQSLWDVPIDTGASALISTLNVDTGDPDFIEPRESGSMMRQNPQVHKDARIFHAVAWANKYDIRIILLFPEVFHAGCTCNTSNTNNNLLSFSCRTSTGKQVVFLRAWIPNQKMFAFHWVSKFVLSSSFDVHVFHKTHLVMVNGDPQQRAELSKAILSYMPNASSG
jgi:hypothetical protein